MVIHEESNNQTIKSKSLGENQHKNHGDEDLFLLGVGADGGVADDANRKSGSKRRESSRHAGAEVQVSREGGVTVVLDRDVVVDDDGDDEAVDAKDTRHDDGDDATHDAFGRLEAEVSDAAARLGRAVRGAEVGEDERDGGAHAAEEGGGAGVVLCEARLVLLRRVAGFGELMAS